MMWARASGLGLSVVRMAGCAGTMTSARRYGDGTIETRPAEIHGTLVEVRHYLETGAVGGAHTLCAFLSALGEAPLGIVEDDGTLVMLTSRPSRIAPHVTKAVRVTGRLTIDGQLLIPQSLQVKDGATWITAEP